MNISGAYRAIDLLAKREGVTREEIIEKIDEAIVEAIASPNPSVQEAWSKIPHAGERPSAAEVIAYLADKAQQ